MPVKKEKKKKVTGKGMNKLIFLFYATFCSRNVTDAFPFSRPLYSYHTRTLISKSVRNRKTHDHATAHGAYIKLYDAPSYYSYDGHLNDDDDDEEEYNDEIVGNRISDDIQAARERLEALITMGGVGVGGEGSVSATTDTATTTDNTAAIADSNTAMIAEKKNEIVQEVATKNILQKGQSLSFLKPFINSDTFEIALVPPTQPLTARERQRRYEEIDVLKCLLKSDDKNSLNNLYNFWFHEKGPRAAKTLEEADFLIGQGNKEGWEDAEKILRYLIEEYGVYWTEPMNCLATLFYLQGRYLESKILYKWILLIKPWHCGALSGIVRVYEAMKDYKSARQCSPNRLPPRSSRDAYNRRRWLWVHKALIRSAEALKRAEEGTNAMFGGNSVDTSNNNCYRNRHKHLENSDCDDDNSWQ